MQDGGRIVMRTVTRGHVEMTWNSVIPDDTSEYICLARNRAGFTETTAKLTVNCECTDYIAVALQAFMSQSVYCVISTLLTIEDDLL